MPEIESQKGPVLDPEAKKTVEKWMDDKWPSKNRVCDICQRVSDWVLAEHAIQLMPYFPSGVLIGDGPIYPCVMAICKICGNTKLFNAPLIGITKGDKNE